MTLSSAIDQFSRFLLAERNLAPRTVEAYRYDLQRLEDYLSTAEPTRPLAVRRIDGWLIKDYLAYLQEERSYKPASLGRVISSVRVFFDYLVQDGVLELNPVRTLHSPKKAKKLPIYLTFGEAGHLIESMDPVHEFHTRDRAMLTLLLMTGLRLAELVGMDLGDVDFDGGSVRVLGKGRKERLVPLNDVALDRLREWFDQRPPSDSPAAFLGKDGERVSRRTVQYVVRRTVKRAGLDPRVSPHKLRHTFATSLYAEDVNLRDIQELLGHADIASTSIYTHTNVEKVRAAVDKLQL